MTQLMSDKGAASSRQTQLTWASWPTLGRKPTFYKGTSIALAALAPAHMLFFHHQGCYIAEDQGKMLSEEPHREDKVGTTFGDSFLWCR